MPTSAVSDTSQVNLTSGLNNRVAADKDTFLKLLVTQLRHQDPLNPTEDKEFITQLAQFTSLETLTNIRGDLGNIGKSQRQQQVVNAVNLIGKEVAAQGDLVSKVSIEGSKEPYVSTIFAELPTSVRSVTVRIYETDKDGKIGRLVHSEALGAYSAGELPYTWNGKDSSGRELNNGRYVVNFTAEKDNGERVVIKTSSQGIVRSVKTSEDGNHELFLEDGRKVNFNNIDYVQTPTPNRSGGNSDSSGDKAKEADSSKAKDDSSESSKV